MPPDDGHDSGMTGQAPSPARDGRVTDLVGELHSHHVHHRSLQNHSSDPHRGAGLEAYGHSGHETYRPVRSGMVVQSFPYYNWYRVQLDGTGPTVAATFGDATTNIPIGPRSTSVLPPGTMVAVWMPTGRNHGVILNTVPVARHDPRLACPDYTSQGGNSSVAQREDVYTLPLQSLYRQGGVTCFGAGMPLDSTSLEKGWVTETGSQLSVDAWMQFLRASEICGVWFHYWDDYARLAGWNFDLQTAAHEVVVRCDEGENRYAEHHNTYPWEAAGLYAPGTDIHDTFTSKQVQFEMPRGGVDLPVGEEDLQPISRYEEFGGYLGQGRRRSVGVPAKSVGARFYSDDPAASPDFGVWEETVGMDGSYAVRSARQLLFAKYSLIPVPKEMRRPEDQKAGDDARKGNYKFSGKFGDGADHKVGSVAVPGTHKSLRTAAGVYDMIAHAFNWQGLHPFHYHLEDYKVPQEKDLVKKAGAPARAQERVDFTTAAGGRMYLADPTGGLVRVDDRYGDVEYVPRVSFLFFPPDGGVVLGDGYGATVTLSGGRIRWDAPLGIDVAPGTDFNVVAGRDINLRARKSVDITAGKDLRAVGQFNVQLLSNLGGVVVESKATGYAADFENKLGEDVAAGGVFIKARYAPVVAWAESILLRTGGDSLVAGDIVLDAAKGRQRVVFKGNTVESYAHTQIAGYVGPVESVSAVEAAYTFDTSSARLGGQQLLVGGDITTLGRATFDGPVYAKGEFASENTNGFVGKLMGGSLDGTFAAVGTALRLDRKGGQDLHTAAFNSGLYLDGAAGDDATIAAAGVSLRDDGKGVQYHADVASFAWAESRWQAMCRMNLGSGGTAWGKEPYVEYQGRQQLPWPGKANWEGLSLLGVEALTLFDPAAGTARDRPGLYETPTLGAAVNMRPTERFLVIEG